MYCLYSVWMSWAWHSKPLCFGCFQAFVCILHAVHRYSTMAASWAKFVMYVTFSYSIMWFCKAGSGVWMFPLLSSLPIILAASQQMVWWWCLRSGHVAASSALCPLYRPLPCHRMTNYFLFVTETQSSEGRGIFCCLSYQTNLRLFPPVGHSLTGSLFLSSLIGDIGRQWEGEIWFLAFKTVTWWISGSICRPSGSCVHAGSGVSLVTCSDLQYH